MSLVRRCDARGCKTEFPVDEMPMGYGNLPVGWWAVTHYEAKEPTRRPPSVAIGSLEMPGHAPMVVKQLNIPDAEFSVEPMVVARTFMYCDKHKLVVSDR